MKVEEYSDQKEVVTYVADRQLHIIVDTEKEAMLLHDLLGDEGDGHKGAVLRHKNPFIYHLKDTLASWRKE